MVSTSDSKRLPFFMTTILAMPRSEPNSSVMCASAEKSGSIPMVPCDVENLEDIAREDAGETLSQCGDFRS